MLYLVTVLLLLPLGTLGHHHEGNHSHHAPAVGTPPPPPPPYSDTDTERKTDYVSEYYFKIPLFGRVVPTTWPQPKPFNYRPFPDCRNYLFRDVLNHPRAFHWEAGTGSNNNAYIMAWLSWAAYYIDDEQMVTWLKCMGVRNMRIIQTRKKNEAMILQTDHAVIVVFQGSKLQIRDWVSNFRYRPGTTTQFGGNMAFKVHKGFNDGFTDMLSHHLMDIISAMCTTIRRKMSECAVFTTGHSRGAAMALQTAAFMANMGWNVAGVFLAEGPRFGDQAFKNHYDGTLGLGKKTLRMFYRNDFFSGVLHRSLVHVGQAFLVERCLRAEPEPNRAYYSIRDHLPSVELQAYWIACSSAPGGLATDVLMPPPYPNGAYGLWYSNRQPILT